MDDYIDPNEGVRLAEAEENMSKSMRKTLYHYEPERCSVEGCNADEMSDGLGFCRIHWHELYS